MYVSMRGLIDSLLSGEEFYIRKDLKVKAFRTHHAIPSQGYIVYSFKHKLKEKYIGLPGNEIKELKTSGVEIMETSCSPKIAFTGDTTAEFIVDPFNVNVPRAKILVMEVFQDRTPYSQEQIDEVRDLCANYFLNV